MIQVLRSLSAPVLDVLVQVLGSGSLTLPCHPMALQDLVPRGMEAVTAAALAALVEDGGTGVTAAAALYLLLEERKAVAERPERADLVWSGPEAAGSLNRDTGVVVRELLERAERSVLIATYALDEGEKVRAILAPLAARLDRGDALDVQVFANIPPSPVHGTQDAEVVAAFAERFRTRVWPGTRMPRLYYDPRSLLGFGPTRASMHAKCVVIDEEIAFVTSANFTEAAHHRNVEVGVVVEGSGLAQTLVAQFRNLVRAGTLVVLPLPNPTHG